MYPLRIARAENDILFAEDGQRYIDLFSAHGATWLGHGNREVAAQIGEQLQRVWITGGLDTAVSADAKAIVDGFFPASHPLAAVYSTGMEAAGFSLPVARGGTKKNGVGGVELRI